MLWDFKKPDFKRVIKVIQNTLIKRCWEMCQCLLLHLSYTLHITMIVCSAEKPEDLRCFHHSVQPKTKAEFSKLLTERSPSWTGLLNKWTKSCHCVNHVLFMLGYTPCPPVKRHLICLLDWKHVSKTQPVLNSDLHMAQTHRATGPGRAAHESEGEKPTLLHTRDLKEWASEHFSAVAALL